ncbi:hypothetical protein AB5J62_21605 [Amycolatopsis sp. cg5]|uniref:hypothetical protein n=1 Tax=Amycolatopsis sp. cg5 TaxID=3238802 RepID=UPI003526986A
MLKRTIAAIGAAATVALGLAVAPGVAQADPPGPCGFWHTDDPKTPAAYYTNCSYISVHHIVADVIWSPDQPYCVAVKETLYLGGYSSYIPGYVRGATHDYDC